MYYNLAKSKYL